MTELDERGIAFVVIGRNEGERLTRSLRSVLSVSRRVVYADSGSTDRSVERAREMGAQVVVLDDKRPMNAARGRNEGFARVRELFPEARFVQFLDGDCILQPGWIPKAVTFLEKSPDFAVACGRRFEARPQSSFYNRLADEEWNTPVGEAEACGGDALMRVEALEQVGGFNPLLMASEEPELCARLRAKGWKICRLDTPMTEHDAAIFRFSQWWRRTTRTGYGYAQAWRATAKLRQPVNQRKLRSALFWVVGVPAIGVALVLATGRAIVFALVPVAYAVQIARIALRRRDRSMFGWRASTMTMLAKAPELIGAARALLSGRQSHMIEYKGPA